MTLSFQDMPKPPPPPDDITLSTDQQDAVEQATAYLKEPGSTLWFKIGGYAGTGKTTVAKYIAEQVPGVMPCAFTGKAAYRLRQKGVSGAATIHSTIYEHSEEKMVRSEPGKAFDDNGAEYAVPSTTPPIKVMSWLKKESLPGDWFLIDEGSMISRELWEDLLSYNKPMLLLGDPGQLEPVGADARLMHECDVVLEQIHRQKEGNGIIQYATDIRLKNRNALPYGKDVTLGQGRPTVGDFKWADIVICAFNRTRVRYNKTMRAINGHRGQVKPSERVIILRNNSQYGVFNGQIVTVTHVRGDGDVFDLTVRTDEGDVITFPVLAAQFGAAKTITHHKNNRVVLVDFGYAITCHKSQGSEWDRVVVMDEQQGFDKWDTARWLYTACTRAARQLRVFSK